MTYHQDRFEDASILVFEEDKLLAIFPANRAGDGCLAKTHED